MQKQQGELDRFFRDLFRDLKPVFYWRHPSEQAWREYLRQDAHGETSPGPEQLLDWSESRLQLRHHLLTCSRCARQLARLHNRPRQSASLLLKPSLKIPRPIEYGVLAVLLIAVSLWISIPPTPPPPPSEIPVLRVGPGGGGG
jgi:hypothetical protein